MSKPSYRTVDHQYLIRAPKQAVFRAITQPKWLTRWLCDHAEVDRRRGGSYRLGWTGGPTHTGKIVGYRDGRSISFGWSWPGIELRGTVLSLEVESVRGGTVLKVKHTGFPRQERWTDLYGGAEWGWTYFAMNLRSVLETGTDLRAPIDG